MDGQQTVGLDFGPGADGGVDHDLVPVGRQARDLLEQDARQHHPELLRMLLAERRDALHHGTARHVDQRRPATAEVDLDGFDRQRGVGIGLRPDFGLGGDACFAVRLILHLVGLRARREESGNQHRAHQHERGHHRQAGQQHQQSESDAHEHERLGKRRHLAQHFETQVLVRGRPRDDDAGAHRDHERRYLRDDAVADRQQGVGLQRFRP